MVDRRAARARKIQQSIAHELLHGWDPLGVRDEPQCLDEYDCYVAGVYRLLAHGASASDIAEHLALKEQRELEFTTPAARLLDVAMRLKAIDVGLDGSDGAV